MFDDVFKSFSRGVLFEVGEEKLIKIEDVYWMTDTHKITVTIAMDNQQVSTEIQEIKPRFFIKAKLK